MMTNKMKIMLAIACWVLVAVVSTSGRTITVGGTDDEFQTIQAAIDAATAGDSIQVAPGIYRETLLISKDDLEIVGAGNGLTVIEHADIVIRYLGASEGRLQGMTIRYLGEEEKPAVLVDASSPLIVDNEITGATLAGVEIQSGANPTLFENHIHNNAGSGVLIYLGAAASLMGNTIEKNGLEGTHAGVEVREGSSATLHFNKIILNGGSGVFLHQSARAEVLGNSIIGNGLHGVSILDGASAKITSNSIWWNVEVGIRLKDNSAVSITGNFIAYNLIGLLADEKAVLPSQNGNLFLVNARDLRGAGLSTLDAQLNDSALSHPRTNQLFQALGAVGEIVQSLGDDPSLVSGEMLTAQAQAVELIGADVYRLFGLTEEAAVRYRMVIQLNLNSQAASEARAKLDTLSS